MTLSTVTSLPVFRPPFPGRTVIRDTGSIGTSANAAGLRYFKVFARWLRDDVYIDSKQISAKNLVETIGR